ncbi:hypothetical protein V6N13_129789 [Hibiscus sabdariffa]|uniref:Uncharacterized protein n=1 Tax=Hibiscus sabdariffa TaxID=183260 RepID=A0ABR2SM74_9ROSI
MVSVDSNNVGVPEPGCGMGHQQGLWVKSRSKTSEPLRMVCFRPSPDVWISKDEEENEVLLCKEDARKVPCGQAIDCSLLKHRLCLPMKKML